MCWHHTRSGDTKVTAVVYGPKAGNLGLRRLRILRKLLSKSFGSLLPSTLAGEFQKLLCEVVTFTSLVLVANLHRVVMRRKQLCFTRVQLVQVLETRKSVLQKEQDMAFTHAIAASLDIDNLAYLIPFAECFGPSRMWIILSNHLLKRCKIYTYLPRYMQLC